MTRLSTRPAGSLLSPSNHALVMIDHQGQMGFAVRSIDVSQLRTNAAMVAQAAAGFGVPTVLTSVAEKTFSGPLFDEVRNPFPKLEVIDRTTMNCFEDQKVVDAVNDIGKQRIVLAGLWTSVCIAGPALTALEQGSEVYVMLARSTKRSQLANLRLATGRPSTLCATRRSNLGCRESKH